MKILMTPLVLIQKDLVALYHGRKQIGIWNLEEVPNMTTAELIEEIRTYKPESDNANV